MMGQGYVERSTLQKRRRREEKLKRSASGINREHQAARTTRRLLGGLFVDSKLAARGGMAKKGGRPPIVSEMLGAGEREFWDSDTHETGPPKLANGSPGCLPVAPILLVQPCLFDPWASRNHPETKKRTSGLEAGWVHALVGQDKYRSTSLCRNKL